MVQVKYVNIDLVPGVPKPWWFGYGKPYQQQIDGLVNFLFARAWITRLKGGLRSMGLLRRSSRV
jgi:hypothetical protein